jgi:hypothetical protein
MLGEEIGADVLICGLGAARDANSRMLRNAFIGILQFEQDVTRM